MGATSSRKGAAADDTTLFGWSVWQCGCDSGEREGRTPVRQDDCAKVTFLNRYIGFWFLVRAAAL